MLIYLYCYFLVAALSVGLIGMLYLRRRVQFLRHRLARADEAVQVLTNEREERRQREGKVDASVVVDRLEGLRRDIQDLRVLVLAQSRKPLEIGNGVVADH